MTDTLQENHEVEYIKAFVARSRCDRYLSLSGSKKGRHKFLALLSHNHIDDLVPGCVYQIPPTNLTTESILQIIANLSRRKDCYLISEYPKLDKQTLRISDALNEIFGLGMGTILSIEPGKLAYYESEEENGRYIISMPKKYN